MEVSEQGAYTNLALQAKLKATGTREAALTKQLVFGTVTYRNSLDYLLQHWLTRPLESLDPLVRNILRLGLYQVIYLRIPDHAAVSESVSLAKAVSHQGAAGLVNAVLRRAIREREQLPWPKTGDPGVDLGIRFSFPAWMVRRWVDRLGLEQAEAFCQASNATPGIDLRVNSLRLSLSGLISELTALGIEAAPHPLIPQSVRISGASVFSLPALERGDCTVQGAASTLVGLAVAPEPGQLVYDICAAPGGKALHLAELMKDQGQVLAIDNHANRLQLVETAAHRMQLKAVKPVLQDATKLALLGWPTAGRVLVDAPCSGLGVIRRKPDIRWHRTLSDIIELAKLQGEILSQSAHLVQPGGVLVYSVCSTEREETVQVISRFLAEQPEFEPAIWPEQLRQVFSEEIINGQLTTYPHKHNLDGFFICRMQRRC